uniref:Uncharacterized protein n=1 Tax=Arundo donax TaxID=35708 RepID=A0A0A9EVC2_ARUDO
MEGGRGSPVVLFALIILHIVSLFAEPAAAQPFGGCQPYGSLQHRASGFAAPVTNLGNQLLPFFTTLMYSLQVKATMPILERTSHIDETDLAIYSVLHCLDRGDPGSSGRSVCSHDGLVHLLIYSREVKGAICSSLSSLSSTLNSRVRQRQGVLQNPRIPLP